MTNKVLYILLFLLSLNLVACGQQGPRIKPPQEPWGLSKTDKDPVPAISAESLEELISEEGGLVILDVREGNEFSEKHIPGAINFPRSTFARTGELPLNVVDPASTIAVYCGGGFRSSYIAMKLKEAGYNAFNLEDGLKSWEGAGFDLTRGPKIPPTLEPLTIGLEEAYELYYREFGDKVLWVDLRDKDMYDMGHIKGAINLPIYFLKDEINTLPKNKQIVLYCSGPSCTKSTSAGRTLIENGFKKGRIRTLTGGYNRWKAAGYPVNKTPIKGEIMKKASARHILVSSKEACEDLKSRIEAGADFAKIAAENSTCPSGKQGGDLGEFFEGQMVPEFDQIVFTAEIGKVHGPVKTDFGYHLIEITGRTE